MPKGIFWPALARLITTTGAVFAAVACTPLAYPGPPTAAPLPLVSQPPPEALDHFVSDLTLVAPDTQILTPPPGSDTCGRGDAPVIRGVFPERVLFATGSDEPAPYAAAALDLLADRTRHASPESNLTVLGHTDAVGSDAYNIDLSRRRALRVLRALVARGLDPAHLSAVAIGRRQPIADNGTTEGRARNRRVEFLISTCLAANLGVVRAQPSVAGSANVPIDVLRLDPSSPYGPAVSGTISLGHATGDRITPAMVAPTPSRQPPALKLPATVARPALAPHYQPNTLAPDARPNSLGPAVPF